MFRALREMTRRPATQLTFHDDAGRIISNTAEINTRVTDHFSRQFTDPTVDGLDAFTGEPSQLTRPITPEEVTLAIGKLNTGRASVHDDIPAEFLKCSAELLSHTIANIFNDALQHHELLDIGKGVLILVQKPGKPTGQLTSLRPIVYFPCLGKHYHSSFYRGSHRKSMNTCHRHNQVSEEDAARPTWFSVTAGYALKRSDNA